MAFEFIKRLLNPARRREYLNIAAMSEAAKLNRIESNRVQIAAINVNISTQMQAGASPIELVFLSKQITPLTHEIHAIKRQLGAPIPDAPEDFTLGV